MLPEQENEPQFFPHLQTLLPSASFCSSLCSTRFSLLKHVFLSLQLALFLTSSAPVLVAMPRIPCVQKFRGKNNPPF